MAWPNDADRLVETLTESFARIHHPGGRKGFLGTERAFWTSLLTYARLFQEEPVLRSLAQEMDAEAERVRTPAAEAAVASLAAMAGARAFLGESAQMLYGRRGVETGLEITVVLDERQDPGDLARGLEAIAATLRREFEREFDEARWMALKPVVDDASDTWNEIRRRHGLLALCQPWDAWRVLSDVGQSPDWVAETAVGRKGMIAFAMLGKLGIERQHEVVNMLLPDLDVFMFELPKLHQWVIRRLRSGQVRWYALSRYKESMELFRGKVARDAVANRRPGTNDDELALRDDLALHLHDRGFRVTVEPLIAAGRPDLVAVYAGERVDMPAEVKVIREGDAPSVIIERLSTGMAQALAYTRRSNCDLGFLVVFWLGNREYDLAPSASFSDCSVHVFVVDLRGAPSEWTGRDRVAIPAWQALLGAPTPAVGETPPL